MLETVQRNTAFAQQSKKSVVECRDKFSIKQSITNFWRTVRSILGYDVSSVCRLSVICNACIVAKRYVVEVGNGYRWI